jgi:hypothetical protein
LKVHSYEISKGGPIAVVNKQVRSVCGDDLWWRKNTYMVCSIYQ